jgi:hypothetical protein
MSVTVGKGVREYLQKMGDSVAIRMLHSRTAFGCGGMSRPYYMPDIRTVKNDADLSGDDYNKYEDDGVTVWVTPQALSYAADGNLKVELVTALMFKRLVQTGIPDINYYGAARLGG